jgi:hypothetical protein
VVIFRETFSQKPLCAPVIFCLIDSQYSFPQPLCSDQENAMQFDNSKCTYYLSQILNMRTIALLSIFLISFRAFCQDDFKKGYIVNGKSDTIRGYIKQDLEEVMLQSITFRDASRTIKTLSTSDIKAFGFDQGPTYRLISYVQPTDTVKKQVHFAKLLMAGPFDLHSFRKEDNLYFVVYTADSSYLLYDDQMTQLGQVTEQGNFRNFLAFFARGCPKVSASAEKVNFNEQALITYFSSLEKCEGTFKRTQISYSKPKTEHYILVTAGAFALDKKSEIFAQALIQSSWPSFSKKTSLNSGLTYSRNSRETITPYSLGEIEDEVVTELYELPLIVRYNILSTRVRPYIYGGAAIGVKRKMETVSKVSSFETESFKSDHRSVGAAALFGCGIDVSVWKNLVINVDWHYDEISHLPVVGIGYRSNKF